MRKGGIKEALPHARHSRLEIWRGKIQKKKQKDKPCQKSAGLLLYLARKEYFHSCHLFPISKKRPCAFNWFAYLLDDFAMMPTSAKKKCISLWPLWGDPCPSGRQVFPGEFFNDNLDNGNPVRHGRLWLEPDIFALYLMASSPRHDVFLPHLQLWKPVPCHKRIYSRSRTFPGLSGYCKAAQSDMAVLRKQSNFSPFFAEWR